MRAGEKVLRTMWAANQAAKPGLETLLRGGMVYDQPMVGFASRYVDYKTSVLKEDAVPLKKAALDNINKVVIGSRQRTDEHVVRNAAPLLKHVTHEEFKELLLAPMQKSMLRNPEIVLGTIAIILQGCMWSPVISFVRNARWFLIKAFYSHSHWKFPCIINRIFGLVSEYYSNVKSGLLAWGCVVLIFLSH